MLLLVMIDYWKVDVTDEGKNAAVLNPGRVVSKEVFECDRWGNASEMDSALAGILPACQQYVGDCNRFVTSRAQRPLLPSKQVSVCAVRVTHT